MMIALLILLMVTGTILSLVSGHGFVDDFVGYLFVAATACCFFASGYLFARLT